MTSTALPEIAVAAQGKLHHAMGHDPARNVADLSLIIRDPFFCTAAQNLPFQRDYWMLIADTVSNDGLDGYR
jgi:hypothetical protein